MPGRRRTSVSDSVIITSKLRTGGHVVKSGFAIVEISLIVPWKSRSETASACTVAPLASCTFARSTSSRRQFICIMRRSGSSAMAAPNQARSPRLNSGPDREKAAPARRFGSNETVPSAGAFMVSAATIRSLSSTSYRALSRF